MTVATTLALPLNNYAVGEIPLGPAVLPDWVRRVQVSARRCTTADPAIWPDEASRIEIPCQVSLDGGQTWLDVGGFGAAGGVLVNRKTGQEYATSSSDVEVPEGTDRQFRADMLVSGADAYTEIELTLKSGDA